MMTRSELPLLPLRNRVASDATKVEATSTYRNNQPQVTKAMNEQPSSLPSLAVRRIIAYILFVPTLMWNFLLGRILRVRNWWDEIVPHVYMGAFPFSFDVPRMAELGIGGVVNTCEEYAGPVKAYQRFGIEQLRTPTVDFTPPSLASVEEGVAFMRQQVAAGRDVYVHCKAGRARSGTVVMCYLIAACNMTPDEAQQQILERRPHANPRLARRAVVQQFWAKVRGNTVQGDTVQGDTVQGESSDERRR